MYLAATEIEKFNAHVLANYPNEACGIVVHGEFIAIDNIHEDPLNNFRMPHDVYLNYADKGLQAILHSHVKPPEKVVQGDVRAPSKNDMAAQQAINLPWGIAVTEGQGVSDILWFGEPAIAPLLGRQFVHGVTDCFSLIRDYYRSKYDIVLPDDPRTDQWWRKGQNIYIERFPEMGFIEIPIEKIRPGDSVLMSIRAPVSNHAAIYVGDAIVDGQLIKEQLLHHLFARLSGYDSFAKWRPVMTHALRYKTLFKEGD